jgi:CDGSH-type Zn-finger protein
MVNPQAGVVGPIMVRGGITIEGADGTVYEKRNRVTLCRCGKSKNKPFCDGSHT